jgi:hypothetical protein
LLGAVPWFSNPHANISQELEPWLAALKEVLCALDGEALHKEVLPAALERGQVNEGVRSRVLCCKLLALLIPYLVGAAAAGCRGLWYL